MSIIDAAGVSAWQPAIKQDDPALPFVVDAVNDWVTRLPIVADNGTDDAGNPLPLPGGVKLGALMLAVKTHRRRNSPNGIEQVTGDGIAFVARHDPEISRYLGLDRPAVS